MECLLQDICLQAALLVHLARYQLLRLLLPASKQADSPCLRKAVEPYSDRPALILAVVQLCAGCICILLAAEAHSAKAPADTAAAAGAAGAAGQGTSACC
jgi:hypothetical protein